MILLVGPDHLGVAQIVLKENKEALYFKIDSLEKISLKNKRIPILTVASLNIHNN